MQRQFGARLGEHGLINDRAGSNGYTTGLAANRPAASAANNGALWYSTDTDTESRSDGTGWVILDEPEQSYTPTFGNLTLGNGTVFGSYNRRGGWCEFVAALTWGTTSSWGGAPPTTVSLPKNTGQITVAQLQVGALDVSVQSLWYGMNLHTAANASSVTIYPMGVSGTRIAAIEHFAAAAPFPWANGDFLWVRGKYQMNTRYL